MLKRIAAILSIGIALCWAASYAHIGVNRPGGDLSRGQLVDGAIVLLDRSPSPGRIAYDGSNSFLRTLWWPEWPFGGTSMTIGTRTIHVIIIPLWILLICAIASWLLLPGRRFAPGQCAQCGYDLRGASHRACPECGQPTVTT